MTEIDDETQVLPVFNGNGHAASASVLDALKAQRAAHIAGRTLDIDVPGMRSLLVLRLGPLKASVMMKLRERLDKSRSPERDFNMNADVLIAACVEVLGRAHAEDTLSPLDEEEPVRLDARLAELLEIEATSAREIVRDVFKGAPSPALAANMIVNRYMEWASAVDDEADEAFLGEAEAPAG